MEKLVPMIVKRSSRSMFTNFDPTGIQNLVVSFRVPENSKYIPDQQGELVSKEIEFQHCRLPRITQDTDINAIGIVDVSNDNPPVIKGIAAIKCRRCKFLRSCDMVRKDVLNRFPTDNDFIKALQTLPTQDETEEI